MLFAMKKRIIWGPSFMIVTCVVVSLVFVTSHKTNFFCGNRVNEFNSTSTSDPKYDASSYWDSLKDTNELTGTQIMQYFKWTNRSSCELVHDFGGKMREKPSGLDGQKAICIDSKVAPRPGECLVYSFGIADDWSFDQTMESYGCEVFSFDPTIEKSDHDHSQHIHFYRWGVGTRDDDRNHDARTGQQYNSLSAIYEKLSARHGRKPIDYLKMDIEANEWDVVPDIIKSGMLSLIRQMAIEIHLPNADPIENYRELAAVLRSLEKSGMVRFDSKFNPWFGGNFTKLHLSGSYGYEIAWYNRNLFHTK